MPSTNSSPEDSKEILRIEKISKYFPGVQALKDVSFRVHRGEVHGLVGANGAGKSTLNKIIAGVIQPDAGEIFLNGYQILPLTPKKSQEIGIQVIHQDLNLVPYMSVIENVFLGHEYRKRGVFVDKARTSKECKRLLDELGVSIDPNEKVKNLSVSYQQMVAVAAALQRRASVLVFDETTAAITKEEIDHLFQRIRMLKAKQLGMIYVSHHLEEIFDICDRVTVLRDGNFIGTRMVKETSRDEIISMMVGHRLKEQFPEREITIGDELLSVEGLAHRHSFKDISFNVHAGEILGFFGLVGSGRTEIFTSIFGAQPFSAGRVLLNGKQIIIKKPAEAVSMGLGLVPEDRKKLGVLMALSVLKNITLPSLKDLCNFSFIDKRKERNIVENQINHLKIATPNFEREVRYLSGGNQQKVVLAKWLVTKSSILILDQPTRGIDVEAKTEIYRIINKLAMAGHAIIFISDELQEIANMCDRIVVMHEGRIQGILEKNQTTQQKLLSMANGSV